MRRRRFAVMLVVPLLVGLLLFGCVTIPKEAPELSAELGNRITAIEDANVNLLRRYFDLKREEVDRFMKEEWVPEFAKQFFEDPDIDSLWQQVVDEGTAEDRLKFLLVYAPRLQAAINERRLLMIAPLDDIERRMERKLRDEYDLALSVNGTITTFLMSAAELDETRGRYLKALGLEDKSVGTIMTKTDAALALLSEKAEGASAAVDKAEAYFEHMKKIGALLGGPTEEGE